MWCLCPAAFTWDLNSDQMGHPYRSSWEDPARRSSFFLGYQKSHRHFISVFDAKFIDLLLC